MFEVLELPQTIVENGWKLSSCVNSNLHYSNNEVRCHTIEVHSKLFTSSNSIGGFKPPFMSKVTLDYPYHMWLRAFNSYEAFISYRRRKGIVFGHPVKCKAIKELIWTQNCFATVIERVRESTQLVFKASSMLMSL